MHRLCFRFSSCSVSSPSRSVVKVSSRHRNLCVALANLSHKILSSTCLRVMSNLDPNAAYKSEVDTLGHLDTKVIKIDPTRVDEEEAKFEVPTSLIRKGEVVAFPTETVYGLGANALDASAVSKVQFLPSPFLLGNFSTWLHTRTSVPAPATFLSLFFLLAS